MSDRSVVGLFINPAHQSRMMPAKYASIMMSTGSEVIEDE